jgi:putative FmdB family regulatory protein
MPVYEYRCEGCGRPFEIRRSMLDDRPPECPRCASAACRRIFTSVSIVISESDRVRDLSWVDRDLARRLREKSGGALSPEFRQTLDRMEGR